MFKKIIYLTVLVFCFSLPVSAKNLPGAFTLSPMLGGHIFEGNQPLESTNIWGLGLGYNFTENWAIEGIYTRTDTDAEAEDNSTSATKVETYHLDALYHFQPTKKLVPYVVAGIGAIYSSPAVDSDRDHFFFNYGIGIKYFILDDLIALRAEVRHLIDFPEPDNNLQYLAGLTFHLGKSDPPPAPVAIAK